MSKKKERGLFDDHFRLEKIGTMRDPLILLNEIVNWEDFRPIIDTAFSKVDPSKGGRPAYDRVMMFKVLILQRMYNLSDDSAEYQILDRMSFNRFLGIELCDDVPDAKTIWHYREQLVRHDIFNKIFVLLNEKLAARGLILNNGSIVDAHIVNVPRQRNTRDENKQIKDGEIPESWKSNPSKLRQKDTDASWLKKNNVNHFGYKNHVKVDIDSKLITSYVTTPANYHDSELLDDLLDESDAGKPLYGDSAYSGKPCEKIIKRKRAINKTHKKAYRNKPLTSYQKRKNTAKSKIRARVEHVFGHMYMCLSGSRFLRYIGYLRVGCALELTNITYNLQRACYLIPKKQLQRL
jgi:transposase, IS5 family